MCPAGRGYWVSALFLPPGRYNFSLVVDGLSIGEPAATEAKTPSNGGKNFVLVV